MEKKERQKGCGDEAAREREGKRMGNPDSLGDLRAQMLCRRTRRKESLGTGRGAEKSKARAQYKRNTREIQEQYKSSTRAVQERRQGGRMNQTIRELKERVSVRSFLKQEISPEAKEAILSCAFAAPTAGNQQLYTILEITQEETKRALSALCDHQAFICDAAWILLFLSDTKRYIDVYKAAGISARKAGMGDFLLSYADCNIAAQNAVTAAWSLGIGSCYIGDILENAEEVKVLLNLEEGLVPGAMVVFGYAKHKAKKPARFLREEIVMENTYHAKSEETLKKMFASRAGRKGFEAWVKAFYLRKYESRFAKEMNRSAAVYTKTFFTQDETEQREEIKEE